MTAAETLRCVAGRDFQRGESGGLRQLLRLLKESEFYAKFGVAVSIMRTAVFRCVVSHRRDEMKLHVGDHAIIDFNLRCTPRPVIGGFRVLGGDVKLPI